MLFTVSNKSTVPVSRAQGCRRLRYIAVWSPENVGNMTRQLTRPLRLRQQISNIALFANVGRLGGVADDQ